MQPNIPQSDSPDPPDDKGETPLFAAVRSGQRSSVEVLLERGASPSLLNKR